MIAIYKITLLKIYPLCPQQSSQNFKVQRADDSIHRLCLYYYRVALSLGALVPCPCL